MDKRLTRMMGKTAFKREPPEPTALAYRVRTLGRIRDQPYHSTPGTHFDDVMLTVVLGGAGRYLHAGRTLGVGAGMVGLVTASDDPGLLIAEPGDPYDHVFCRFTGGEARAVVVRLLVDWGSTPFRHHPAWQDVADVLLRALASGDVGGRRGHDRPIRADAALHEVLTILETPPAPAGDRITAERLRRHMEDHLSDPADLDAVARHFGVSKPHLCRVAKRELGRPLHQTWETMKIDWAGVLLREPSLSVGEVARRVGYADALYFSKVFRKRTGRSPSAWRQPEGATRLSQV